MNEAMNYIFKRMNYIDTGINQVLKAVRKNKKMMLIIGGVCLAMYSIHDSQIASLKRRINSLENDIQHQQEIWFNNTYCSTEKGASEE